MPSDEPIERPPNEDEDNNGLLLPPPHRNCARIVGGHLPLLHRPPPFCWPRRRHPVFPPFSLLFRILLLRLWSAIPVIVTNDRPNDEPKTQSSIVALPAVIMDVSVLVAAVGVAVGVAVAVAVVSLLRPPALHPRYGMNHPSDDVDPSFPKHHPRFP